MSSRAGDRPPLEREFSAGGVVVRGDEVAVVVVERRGHPDEHVLALPKGLIDPGESSRETATREVREETGLEAELVEKLGDVRYWFVRGGRRVLKNVAFFLFEYRSGSLADHDHEIVEARWLPLARAARDLTYRGEREMVERVLSRRGSGR
jgi:8-oxo-dGTP pyrophosphatase MutT (NUDIX family)